MYFSYVFLLLLTRAQCANILGFFLFPSISHQSVFQPIWRELSLRGHNVTVVTPDPLNDPKLTNLTEINTHDAYKIHDQFNMQELMSKDASMLKNGGLLMEFADAILEAELNNTQVKELIADQNRHFDLILIEVGHPVLCAFIGRFKAPAIGVSSLGVTGMIHEIFGNPDHPVLYPDVFLNYENRDLSLWQKIKSVLFKLSTQFLGKLLYSRSQTLAQKYFGDDIPFLGDLQKNLSMLFLNVNPLIYPPRPNVPAVVELGQMHIKPAKPLPKDLQKLLDEATEGVIYFSLGASAKSTLLNADLQETIIEALAELPYKVLWKWESDHLPGRPSNVITRKWWPQQDVLAHPNIRAFVTQGGLQSIEEAISREVPVVGMPIMADQPMNVQTLVEAGVALAVDVSTVTKEELKNSIVEVAENPKYKKKMKEVRNLIFDKPMTGLEKAVYWSEYVIRHKGAKHLRSPTADISWFDYLLVDVIITLLVVVGAILYKCYILWRIAKSCMTRKTKKE